MKALLSRWRAYWSREARAKRQFERAGRAIDRGVRMLRGH